MCSFGPPDCRHTNRSGDCAALLDLQKVAPACLGKVAPKDFCDWQAKADSQQIFCRGGRVKGIALEPCSLMLLPASIGDLTGLKGLDVAFNGLTSLPASIGGLTGMIGLDLNNNSLTTLPASLSNLTGVMATSADGNPGLATCFSDGSNRDQRSQTNIRAPPKTAKRTA